MQSDQHQPSRAASAAVADSSVEPFRVATLQPGLRNRANPLLPTLYVSNRLLVRGLDDATVLDELSSALAPLGLRIQPHADRDQIIREVRGAAAKVIATHWVSTVILEADDPAVVVDADAALETLRHSAPKLAKRVGLDHVLGPAGGQFGGIGGQFGGIGGQFGGIGGQFGGIGGQFGGIGGQFGGIGSPAEFGVPGLGGRMPVHFSLRNPAEHVPEPVRRPVVAVVDSGLGQHPWFDGDPTVQVGGDFHGAPLGGPNTDGGDGVMNAMTGAMAPLAGHGTFIAGIIRQGSPTARLLCIPVFSQLGVADEGFVHRTLVLLLARHVEALEFGRSDGLVDVLSLSLGYYHEQSDDPAAAPALRNLLMAYGSFGVIVVAGVGNDATDRPFFPAAFAADDVVLSVGALNPGGASVALFSNGGAWVRHHRPGAAVVSTMPRTVDPGARASVRTRTTTDGNRATLDPDAYASGFGVWSGTSFAAPVLAAEAAELLAGLGERESVVTEQTQRQRAIDALVTLTRQR